MPANVLDRQTAVQVLGQALYGARSTKVMDEFLAYIAVAHNCLSVLARGLGPNIALRYIDRYTRAIGRYGELKRHG